MLRLCPRCERHHFTTDACPFCASRPPPQGQRALTRKVVSLAAGAVVVGTFGCAYGAPEPYCPDAGTRDPRDPGCASVDGGAVDGGAVDAGVNDADLGDAEPDASQ
jgi:hypothetical protein